MIVASKYWVEHQVPPPGIGRRVGIRLPARAGGWGGFSLIEIISVISVAIVITALTVPAVNNILRGQAMTSATTGVSSMIDMARTEAMSKNTYVWLGFRNSKGSGNTMELWVTAVRSLDGTSLLSTAGTNIRSLTKVQKFANIGIAPYASLSQPVQQMLATAKEDPGSGSVDIASTTSNPGFEIPVGGANVTFNNILIFTPQGQLICPVPASGVSPTMPFIPKMLVGLAKYVSPTLIAQAEKDSVGLVLYGGSGEIKAFR